MKKMNKLAIIALALPSLALAEGYYVEGAIGANFGDSVDGYGNIADFTGFESDTAPSFHLGTGYALNDNLRLGVRYSYRSSDFSDTQNGFSPMANGNIDTTANGDFKSHAILLEGAYSFDTGTAFSPFVKAGIGYARNSFEVGSLDVPAFNTSFPYGKNSTNNFAWSLGVGVDYALSEQTTLFAEYQYTDLGEVSTQNDAFGDHLGTDHYRTSEINVGLRINF